MADKNLEGTQESESTQLKSTVRVSNRTTKGIHNKDPNLGYSPSPVTPTNKPQQEDIWHHVVEVLHMFLYIYMYLHSCINAVLTRIFAV